MSSLTRYTRWAEQGRRTDRDELAVLIRDALILRTVPSAFLVPGSPRRLGMTEHELADLALEWLDKMPARRRWRVAARLVIRRPHRRP